MTGCLGTDTLTDFLEGRARPDVRARVEAHASRCGACREILSSLARSGTPFGRRTRGAAGAAPALAPGTRVGRYEIVHEVGAGGMGVVYAARDPELGRMIAIKLLHGDDDRGTQERLRREARAMAQLAHPNVVAVYDVGAFDDRIFIAMEYVPGETLARWIASRRSQRDVLEAYRAAGTGLAAAHAAGIVHRDFKPENALIGNDGRVRVGDFGLARAAGAGEARGDAAAARPSQAAAAMSGPTSTATLTASGIVLGTPYYLAPELHAGGWADARSDQFSFCVALFTALYGAWPFDGDTLDALASNVRAGRLCVPRAARRVPRRIRAAIERGLAVDPDARFATLDELLGELAWPTLRRARWAIGAGAALAVAGWLIARSPADAADERCTGAAAEFATAWSPERRGAVEAAFAASRAPFAAAALPRLTGALDQYAARWTQAHTAACRATRILGEQTEAALELRMACLERRRQEAAALVDALATADTGVITRSATAVAGLGDVAGCADLATLRQVMAPPADEATRRKLAALAMRLADARARYETGAFAPALDRARQIAAEATALAYRPFIAEVELQQGQIESSLGDAPAAETTLEAAVWSAEAGRSDLIAARAWVALVYVVGYRKAEFARGLALAPRATAALARLGGNADIEASLERALGAIAFAQRKLDDAAAHDEKAVTLAERAFGAKHINVAKALEGLGTTMMESGHTARGIAILQRALMLYEELLGPDHPSVARTLHNLGQAHITTRNNAEAEQELRRAAAIREAALGPDAPDLAETLSTLGVAVRRRGELREALGLHRRAVALAERSFGPDSLVLPALLVELGTDLGTLGQHAEAEQQLRRAAAIATKLLGPDHIKTALVDLAYADGLMRQSRWRDAASRYEHAIPIVEHAEGVAEDLAGAVAGLGRAYVELDQPKRALALLARLDGAASELPPELRPVFELSLARALWDSGGDRRRAHELAVQARADGKAVELAEPGDAARIERWLASHPIR